MTMTIDEATDTAADEKTLIDKLRRLQDQRGDLLGEINQLRKALRILAADGDAESIETAQTAYDDARAKVARLTQEKADAEGHLDSLNARLDRGDESVSVDDVVNSEKAIERLSRLLKPADDELQRTERALRPLLADQHLAHLAADIIESVTDVPVIVRRKPENAPEVSPALILSQTTSTEDYGTLAASGSVKVTVVGEPEIDWQAIKAAFEDTGSEGVVTSTQVVFDRACWPLPRLSGPSSHALAELMQTFGQAFHAQAAGGHSVQRLVEAGYNPRSIKSEWSGLFRRMNETLEIPTPGEVIGEATFVCALQHERGDSAGLEDIKADLDALVKTFQSEAVGGWSEAGEIVSIELVEIDRYVGQETPWSEAQVARAIGSPVWPYTAQAKLRVTYRFEEA